jgi:hypothetical protein
MKRLLQILVATLTAAVLAVPAAVSAVGYGGIGGKPANPQSNNPRTQSIFIYTLKPGQLANDGVRLVNNTKQQQTISVYPVDSVLSSGGMFSCAQQADPKKDVGSWITMQSSTVTLAPNSNKVVPFTVTVPDSGNIDVGEHDGCIAIQSASETATQSTKSGVLLSFRSAIRVVVTIPGKIVKKLDISSVAVSLAKDNKYQVSPTVQNSGNVSLDTTLKVSLISPFGMTTSATNEGSSPVLPRTKASWNYELKRPFWGGFYRAKVVASYNSNPSAQIGESNNADQATKEKDSALFFVVPSPAAALVELGVVAIIAGAVVLFVKKRLHAKHVKHHWKEYAVEEGDTLEEFAKKHHVSWKKIAKVNKLKAPYVLRKGQKLKLPPEKE